MPRRRERRSCYLTRVDTEFAKKKRAKVTPIPIQTLKCRFQYREPPWQSISLRRLGILLGETMPKRSLRARQNNCPHRPQINLQPRFILQLMHELGIHPRTRRRRFAQCWMRLGGRVDQHSSGGPRRLASRLTFFHYQHAQSLFIQFNCQRKSNDSRPNNNRVAVLHGFILVEPDAKYLKRN